MRFLDQVNLIGGHQIGLLMCPFSTLPIGPIYSYSTDVFCFGSQSQRVYIHVIYDTKLNCGYGLAKMTLAAHIGV